MKLMEFTNTVYNNVYRIMSLAIAELTANWVTNVSYRVPNHVNHEGFVSIYCTSNHRHDTSVVEVVHY